MRKVRLLLWRQTKHNKTLTTTLTPYYFLLTPSSCLLLTTFSLLLPSSCSFLLLAPSRRERGEALSCFDGRPRRFRVPRQRAFVNGAPRRFVFARSARPVSDAKSAKPVRQKSRCDIHPHPNIFRILPQVKHFRAAVVEEVGTGKEGQGHLDLPKGT